MATNNMLETIFKKSSQHKFTLIALGLNLIVILFVYQSVFSMELEGDTWQYLWGHQIYYQSNVFGDESLKGMRTSLGGASLTFGLLQNNFGANPLIYYTASVILKFVSVASFYFLAKKLTANYLAALLSTLLLSVTFAGIEATHWVFNMYAYIGLTFVIWSIYHMLDLPTNFTKKKWAVSFVFACLAVWYATMRTSGTIPLILAWSIYKLVSLRTKDSKTNLIYWLGGFIVFVVIDKFLLGQMESEYSSHYIIGEGLRAIKIQTEANKFDFFLSSASNLGIILLPDITWNNLDFPKIFSFLGGSMTKNVILPSFLLFVLFSRMLASVFIKNEVNPWKSSTFIHLISLGFVWSAINYLILKQGPLNYTSWVNMSVTLFGGYVILVTGYLFLKNLPTRLKDLFFIGFIWTFAFLALPIFQNGGQIFGTYHRYLVTTAPSISLIMAGLITLAYLHKNYLLKVILLLIIFFMIFNHTIQTKAFLDRKATTHNRDLQHKIWQQFTQIVPNKPEYIKNAPNKNPNGKVPTLFFMADDNPLDRETLFETLYFGFLFQASVKYDWDAHSGTGLYYQNYPELVQAIKKNPKILEEFYAVRMSNQNLVNMTDEVKKQLLVDIEKE